MTRQGRSSLRLVFSYRRPFGAAGPWRQCNGDWNLGRASEAREWKTRNEAGVTAAWRLIRLAATRRHRRSRPVVTPENQAQRPAPEHS